MGWDDLHCNEQAEEQANALAAGLVPWAGADEVRELRDLAYTWWTSEKSPVPGNGVVVSTDLRALLRERRLMDRRGAYTPEGRALLRGLFGVDVAVALSNCAEDKPEAFRRWLGFYGR